MRRNRRTLGKMMSEFSQELGISGQKKSGLAAKMLGQREALQDLPGPPAL